MQNNSTNNFQNSLLKSTFKDTLPLIANRQGKSLQTTY